jgi:hypothetical protein
VGGDPFKAQADMVTEVVVVAVGEHTPWLDANVEATDGKTLQCHCRIPVVRELEIDEEIFWAVPHHLDVGLPDADA